VRSFGIVTFSAIARGEHVFHSAFPQLFGWLLQSGPRWSVASFTKAAERESFSDFR
jgi:hypothetical protein